MSDTSGISGVERKNKHERRKKMRKIFSILFALVLVLSFSLVAVPVGVVEANGVTPDRVTAITDAADRLVETQSTATLGLLSPPDYGWDWKITSLTAHSGTPSAYNMYGVVILGLLDAYEETGTASYFDAATGMADHMTQGTASNGDFYKQGGVQEPAGAYDYQFLMRYAEVSTNSAYSDYAIALWEWNKANTAIFASPSALNDALLGWAGSDAGAASWQLAAFGEASRLMGDTNFATGCADLLVADLNNGGGWLLGDYMAEAEVLEFLSQLNSVTYNSTISLVITNLTDGQDVTGCWDDGYAGTFQDTVYAVRALAVYGGTDGLDAARKGAAWLVGNQLGNGGWIDDSGGSPVEYSEQDAEGLRALVATPAPVTVGTNGYYSIQDAIDAASEGDTINVAAGTYDPFTVNTFTGPLTIKSQDTANPAIVKGSQAYGAVNTIIVVTDSTDINLTDLDIEGEGLEGGTPPTIANAYAVIYEDATGEVKDCTISPNTAQFSTMETWGYAHGGKGIGIWNDDNSAIASDVTVDSCTIKEFGCTGVTIADGAIATVKDSTIIGTVFTLADWSVYQAGISVGSGSDLLSAPCTATITGNEIYNVRNTADTTGSCCYGIILNAYKFYVASYPESTAHITGNDIHDNSVGIDANHASPENAYAHNNNIYDNSIDGVLTCSDADGAFVEFDATNNWWGHVSGPYHPDSNLAGLGNRVRSYNANLWQTIGDHVDYTPWLGEEYAPTKSTGTSTGTGTASFTPSEGAIEAVKAVATPPGAPVLPDGVFSFKVTGLTYPPAQTVTITITLPGPVLPVGSAKWWKYQAGAWYSLPIGSDDGDNIITITLTDGVFPGDEDSIAGQITDPGGLGYLVSACRLDISSTEGGSVTTPGEGTYIRYCGTVVSLVATAATGYHFVNWTGDVGTIADVHDASTTITMRGWYSITANFESGGNPQAQGEYTLTISSTAGGSVTSPGEGNSAYEAGTMVNLVASPDDGYEFVDWTGDGITNPDSATTTVTMNGDYSIKASFDFEETTSANPAEGSSGSLGCFIATAAYGTPTAEQIDVLREFRDVVLLESTAGSQFIALYYQLSPPIADFIAGSSFLKTLVRELLVDPVVWVVEATGAIWRN